MAFDTVKSSVRTAKSNGGSATLLCAAGQAGASQLIVMALLSARFNRPAAEAKAYWHINLGFKKQDAHARKNQCVIN